MESMKSIEKIATDLIKADAKDEAHRNILLETFDSIRDDLRRGKHLFALKVRIVCGRQIQGSNVSPKVCILFRQQKRWTQHETVSTNEPFWGESFYFNCVTDVESLLRDNVTFRVVNSKMFRRNLVIGEFQLSLVLVAGEKSRSMFNRWLALIDPKEQATVCKGFLKVCVALVFPNEAEVQWPDPLAYNSTKEDIESAVLTCSGHAFLRMTFNLSIYLMEDIPRYDIKGRKVTLIILELSFAGKSMRTESLSLPDEIDSEPYQIKKEIQLTVSWPSMCNRLNLKVISVNGKEQWPLCNHSFKMRDISVESAIVILKRNIRSKAPHVERDKSVTDKRSKGQGSGMVVKKKDAKMKDKSMHSEGFMPMIGPCFVNMYGAPLDIFDDRVETSYIEKMNAGDIDGCAYRGRMFVRLRSEFCDAAAGENTGVKDLSLGTKEQRDLSQFVKSNMFLLFGVISSVPLVSDTKSMVQFELSVGHNGINSMCDTTQAHPFPSTSFSINPQEILKTQRMLNGNSYSTLTLGPEKPAFLMESSWEDIRYRMNFYNYIANLEIKWVKKTNLIVMTYKLGLSRYRVLQQVRDLCLEVQQSIAQTPIPTASPTEAAMNEMDKQWQSMRYQQLKGIYNRLSAMLKYAISITTGEHTEAQISKAATVLCEKLTDISLLFGNIKKEPQLSIPDIFVYMLVNNERRAYARVPVSSIYYCQSDAVPLNPVDTMDRPAMDITSYRGAMANRVETIPLKLIPGLKGYSEEEYWPIPGMIRIKLLFGLTSTLRNGVLPPITYYGVMYEYTKLGTLMDAVCASGQKSESKTFKTDASGFNSIESSSGLLKTTPTDERKRSDSKWRWIDQCWMPWPDTSVLVSSTAETALDFVYMVYMREKSQIRGKPATWNFIGYFTDAMERIGAPGSRLDKNFAMDTSKWMVMMEKDPITGEEVGWVHMKEFEEYSKSKEFHTKDITTTVRLETNFVRRLLQRKRMRKDMVYVETISISFVSSRDNRWSPSNISRFDGVNKVVDMNESAIRSWTQLQNLPPMSVDFTADQKATDVKPSGEGVTERQSQDYALTPFNWIDDWHELMLPMISKDKGTVDVTFERRKIPCDIIGSDADASVNDNQRCAEFGGSLTDSVFHINQQKGDRLKRIRLRRLIEPTEASLWLQSTVRDRVIKLAPFPSFIANRRVGKRSGLCCLFNTIEQVPTLTTVTAVVETSHISRWEMRCYFHEARDLLLDETKDQLYVYAILSISGMSIASSIILNDFNTQLWRWNETIIFRNLVFHEDAAHVQASPPVMVIEFFRKLPIHNDIFLGRCVIDGENFTVQMEDDRQEENLALQWYKVHLRGVEDAGSILAGFHLRHRDTFRPSTKIFEKSFLTPPEKDMQDLFRKDRVVLDNRKRFEIPAEILPVLVPHVLKITSWGLRKLRNFMLSRVSNPTIEFRIGHNVLQTDSIKYDKSPNFVNKSHSLQIFLPLENSYLPDLFLVVRDSRAFGRSPLVGVAKIPLHVCRFKETSQLDELEPAEIDFLIKTLRGRVRPKSNWENHIFKRTNTPMKINFSLEFFFLFEPPMQLNFRQTAATDDFDIIDQKFERQKSVPGQIRKFLYKWFLSSGSQRIQEEHLTDSSEYRMVLGDETLSKTKPDWWCKYYLSKTNSNTKAINYLEGDRLEFYYTQLEDAEVQIGESVGYFYQKHRFIKVCKMLAGKPSSADGDAQGTPACVKLASIGDHDKGKMQDYLVNYGAFQDVFDMIDLQRCNQFTSDEENRKFGRFLGKVRLYFLGALVGSGKVEEALEELYRSKTRRRSLPYTPLYCTVPAEMTNQDCLVRVYIIRALELQAGNMASLPNSYLEVFTADNDNDTQLSSNKDHSIEMDSNPVYGRMFELYCIVPFQTRLRIRVMDKSGFLFNEEIGSTTIDLEKRMSTIYRATCGLPQCYRQAGINAWRDMHKPSEILAQVCHRFGLDEPHYSTEANSEDGRGSTVTLDELKLFHRYYLFPPGCRSEFYKQRRRISVEGAAAAGDAAGGQLNIQEQTNEFSVVDMDAPQGQQVAARPAVIQLPSGDQDDSGETVQTVESLTENEDSERHPDGEEGDSAVEKRGKPDDDPVMKAIRRKVAKSKSSAEPKPVIFRLEDFDAINESAEIRLGPNDNDSEICRERLALNILRRLPLVREHVETRPLYNPLQPDIVQGRLEMWVDIFSLGDMHKCNGEAKITKKMKAEELISRVRELLPPPIDVSPREPQPYELRVVVWSVHEVINDTDTAIASTGDLYVRGWMEGLGDTQETDVHYNSLEGEGEFNWRFVFQLDYLPHERTICGKQKVSLFNRVLTKIPPLLHLQLWDNRRFRFDDFIGSVELDLSKLNPPTQTKDSCFLRQRWEMDLNMLMEQPTMQPSCNIEETVNLFKVQRVYGYWPLSTARSHDFSDNKSGLWMVGKLLMELEILSKEEAALKPAGLGRGEPNKNPVLPDPTRLGINNNFCGTALTAFRRSCWPNYKWYCIGSVFLMTFIALLTLAIVNAPLSTLTGHNALQMSPTG